MIQLSDVIEAKAARVQFRIAIVRISAPLILLLRADGTYADAPPFADYCQRLQQELLGKNTDSWPETSRTRSAGFMRAEESRNTKTSG